jgi:hypothetical protein
MSAVSKPYRKGFRDDVVRVARNREPGVGLVQIAEDFGIHFTTSSSWMVTCTPAPCAPLNAGWHSWPTLRARPTTKTRLSR